jgi:hypothetical protein
VGSRFEGQLHWLHKVRLYPTCTQEFNRGGIGYYDHKAGFSSLDQAAFPIMFSLLAWPQESSPYLYCGL